jgi:transglutaminase-like putative cysteine protease
MRIRVDYTTTYSYAATARSILQRLRLTPRPHDFQQVLSWRVEADSDVRLTTGEDAFGNIVHTLSTDRPVQGLTLTVSGEVRTSDAAGVVAGAVERLPPGVYLRGSALTDADEAMKAFAARIAAEAGEETLARLHLLMRTIHDEIAFDTQATEVTSGAAHAFAIRRGVCQDLTHIFVSTARRLGIPARYVSGHLARGHGEWDQEAAHAWAEAHVPTLGWVGFDPTNGVSPTEAYIRVAIGLDYLDAAPVRGARSGGGEETMTVKLRVAEAGQQ